MMVPTTIARSTSGGGGSTGSTVRSAPAICCRSRGIHSRTSTWIPPQDSPRDRAATNAAAAALGARQSTAIGLWSQRSRHLKVFNL